MIKFKKDFSVNIYHFKNTNKNPIIEKTKTFQQMIIFSQEIILSKIAATSYLDAPLANAAVALSNNSWSRLLKFFNCL